jgi:hypothetical protein
MVESSLSAVVRPRAVFDPPCAAACYPALDRNYLCRTAPALLKLRAPCFSSRSRSSAVKLSRIFRPSGCFIVFTPLASELYF